MELLPDYNEKFNISVYYHNNKPAYTIDWNQSLLIRNHKSYPLFKVDNNDVQTFEKWFGTVISTKKNVVDKTPQYLRDNRWKFPHVEFGGWHFTSFGDVDFVSNKIHNFSHCNDDDVDENMTETYMKEKLSRNGKFKLTPSPPELIASLPDIFR